MSHPWTVGNPITAHEPVGRCLPRWALLLAIDGVADPVCDRRLPHGAVRAGDLLSTK
ncbi:hypothetical protein [Mesorhizobium sp. 8]|uniref:hypothetical protein n=1 Tax=Mesorhizobium sp. 8 TaxID=2584466 RepID=UPI001AEDD850|nr:hypothetical protein [Mesorhizobium sp. 8]